ncbi:MAG: methyltransferase domain-containing protein [Candidatus Altiarchaeota archaeon]
MDKNFDFDVIASSYDDYKFRNKYYYSIVKGLVKELIGNPGDKTVLDVGCGTGDLLCSLNPKHGLGIDVSSEMIRIAKEKYSTHHNLDFKVGDAQTYPLGESFDFIVLMDVIDHIVDLRKAFKNLGKSCASHSRVIIIYANPLWEPILKLAEKLCLKMPETENRISLREIEETYSSAGFTREKSGTRTIIPVCIPLFSDAVNKIFNMVPGVRDFGLNKYYVLRKAS